MRQDAIPGEAVCQSVLYNLVPGLKVHLSDLYRAFLTPWHFADAVRQCRGYYYINRGEILLRILSQSFVSYYVFKYYLLNITMTLSSSDVQFFFNNSIYTSNIPYLNL